MNKYSAKAPEPIRGILFDKDGTLLDFTPTWLPAYRAGALFAAGGDEDMAQLMMVSTGLDEDTNDFIHGSLLASATTDQIAAAWVGLGAEHSAESLTPLLDDIFAEQTAHSSAPFAGLNELISGLAEKDIILGVATNDGEVSARNFLSTTNTDPFFSFVAGYDSGHGCKPEPGMVLAFCDAHDLPPACVMVVGDNHCDLEMGRAAGAGYVVGVLSGNGTRAELAPFADVIIDGIGDFSLLGIG
ncbi:MAG: HAD family hydrolase [Rhodospirillales bacterium]|nr:HAD family hydrolase [Rhodospirillales bacterium]